MATQDPVSAFVDTLSTEQRTAFLLITRNRAVELQAAVAAATAALSMLYAEYTWVTNLGQVLEQEK